MQKMLTIACALIFLFGFVTHAQAIPFLFSFEGTDEGGMALPPCPLIYSGNAITLSLDNTSLITLTGGIGVNAPGITGFGFDLTDASISNVTSWTLATGPTDIGSNAMSDGWNLGTFFAGITRDFILSTPGGNVKGALYNPLADPTGLAASPNYFTTATLEMMFDTSLMFGTSPTLDATSLFVRMQNVGADGEGSLKLTPVPPEPVPEPATLLLLGSGLIALAGLGRKRFFKKNR